MGDAGISFLMTQLIYLAPALLVYCIALILAVMYMNRATLPSVLTLLGIGILVFTTIVGLAIQASLIESRPDNFARVSQIVGVAGSCFRAIGLGVLIAAIFVGRSEPPPDPKFEYRS